MSADNTAAAIGDRRSSSSKTVAIILGAHDWPSMPSLKSSDAFALSASAFITYLRDDWGLNLPSSSIRDLFNSDLTKDHIDNEIRTFLRGHYMGDVPIFDNLIIYYTGHGDFTRGDQHFQLILRSTCEWNSDFSGYTMRQLAATVNAVARKANKLVILDCCYAAAAFEAWQKQGVGDVKQAISLQAVDTFPERTDLSGTILICACDAQEWALYKENDLTMFSGGLMRCLHEGHIEYGDWLTINDLYTLVRTEIIKQHEMEAVAPLLHVPKGEREKMLSLALFPNRAKRKEADDPRWRAMESSVQELRDQVVNQTVALQGIRSALDAMARNGIAEFAEGKPPKVDFRERVKFLLSNPSLPDAAINNFLNETLRVGVFVEQAIWNLEMDEYRADLNAYRVRAWTQYHYRNLFTDQAINFAVTYGFQPDEFPTLGDADEIGRYTRLMINNEDKLDSPVRIPKAGIRHRLPVELAPSETLILRTEYVVLMKMDERTKHPTSEICERILSKYGQPMRTDR